MNTKGLDEMQVQRKNKIGNEAFIMLMYLLLLDTGLYGFGFRWIAYPANIMLILSLCAGIYFVRLVVGNSYIGPSKSEEKPVLKIVLTGLIAILTAAVILVIIKALGISDGENINDMAAQILFISGSAGILIAVLVSVIKRKQNNDSE